MGSATHAVQINGLCASRMLGKARAFAAAADAVAARPDAFVAVVRYASPSTHEPETVAVVSRGTAAPVDAAPVDAAPVDASAAYAAAWLAADTATADLVPFALVADTVDAAAAECTAARVVDAVADAADGYEPDAVAVVVVPAGAWFATCGARPALSFANVADALTYATGHAAPSRRRRRAVLPGEATPPTAPSHGANAPTLPRIR